MNRRRLYLACLVSTVLPLLGCQSPTDPSDTIDVDDVVVASVSPPRATATPSTDGRTYRVVRGNNQPDEVLEFDWHTTFSITLTITSEATDEDVDFTFPLTITAATGKVQQATGGIVTPPTGGEVEHYDSVLTSSSTNSIAGVGGTATFTFEVWYDLPNLRREALITESISFKDADNRAFVKNVDVIVNP